MLTPSPSFSQPRAICSWLFFTIISTCLGQTPNLVTKSIIGTIKSDKDSVGFEGVHLYIRNTATGTVTNVAGEFEIKIPSKFDLSKTEIIVSSIGYKTKLFKADSALN
ncbi:MAG: carboxypeptidase-like regulatory domain-containing protein, partial [Dolichospermum sp.]